MVLIGISGKIGSGKNTTADIIRETSLIHIEERSLAFYLKKIVSILTAIDIETLLSQDGKNKFTPFHHETNLKIDDSLEFMKKFKTFSVYDDASLIKIRNGFATNV